MKLLLQNPGQAVAKSVILERISLDTPDCTEYSLKQHVSNLRKKLREAGDKEYIQAVRALGGSTATVLRRNVLPNVVSPVWAALSQRVGRAILSESSLSFLGVGIRTPQASWGNMIQYATNPAVFAGKPWVWLPPGLCIVATVIALQFVGDGLRDAIDPQMKEQ